MYLRAAIGGGDCGEDIRGDGEALHEPPGVCLLVEAEQGGWDAGAEGDFEAIEWTADALAGGFDDRFLAGPALEEAGRLEGLGESGQMLDLGGCEEVTGNREEVVERVHVLEVDPDVRSAGEGTGEPGTGVAEVEAEGCAGQEGLATGAVFEVQRLGGGAGALCEEGSQLCAAGDEHVTVAVEVEAAGAQLFVGAEGGGGRRRGRGLTGPGQEGAHVAEVKLDAGSGGWLNLVVQLLFATCNVPLQLSC